MKEALTYLVPAALMWIAFFGVCYVFWRDNRLDAEDEKDDRIRGERHT